MCECFVCCLCVLFVGFFVILIVGVVQCYVWFIHVCVRIWLSTISIHDPNIVSNGDNGGT